MAVDTRTLAALPLFASATPQMVAALARRAAVVRFAADEVIFLTGSPLRGWFIVLEGTVRVVRGSRDRQHVIHSESAGGTLAEVPLVEGGTHPATAIAATPTRCALVTRPALEAAIAEQPQLAFILASRLASRVRLLVDRLDERSASNLDARLIEFLLRRPEDGSTGTVALGMTQQALAEELGTVREVVVRTLRRLCRRGLIERVVTGQYRIRNRRALASHASNAADR